MRIGVFDSGVGGITVLSELRKQFPAAEFVYLGDTAHLPYGTKSPAQIRKLSVNCAKQIRKKGVDALVVACNTASSWAMDAIRREMGRIPVYGVVEPGVEAAMAEVFKRRSSKTKIPLVIFATRATVKAQAYSKLLKNHAQASQVKVAEQACPLLVPMIEEGWLSHPILHQTIQVYSRQHRTGGRFGVAVLGCTHYPWIHRAFEKALPGWKVVNSAAAICRALERELPLIKKDRTKKIKGGHVEWIFTDPDGLPAFAQKLIGKAKYE